MSLKKLPDGRYIIRYYHSGTKRSRRVQEILGAIPHKDAVAKYKQRLAEAAARRGRVEVRLTFAELAAKYLEHHGPILAKGSRQKVETLIGILPRDFLARPVDDLQPLDVRRFMDERAKTSKPATVNRDWHVIRAVLNWGREMLGVPNRVVGAIRSLKLENQGARTAFFEPEEWHRFITAFDSDEPLKRYLARRKADGVIRMQPTVDGGVSRGTGGRNPDSESTQDRLRGLRATVPVFWTLLYTGARLSEILTLRWSQVDLRRNLITVKQSKTGKRVVLPMAADLRAVMVAQSPGVGEARVFTRPDGEPFYPVEIQRAFALAKKLAGIRADLTPHSLRHTLGSWLVIAGEPLRTVQEILGHSSPVVTARHYAHLAPAHLETAVNRIADLARVPEVESGAATAPQNGVLGEVDSAEGADSKWRPQRDSNPCCRRERAVS
jgi:integrase